MQKCLQELHLIRGIYEAIKIAILPPQQSSFHELCHTAPHIQALQNVHFMFSKYCTSYTIKFYLSSVVLKQQFPQLF